MSSSNIERTREEIRSLIDDVNVDDMLTKLRPNQTSSTGSLHSKKDAQSAMLHPSNNTRDKHSRDNQRSDISLTDVAYGLMTGEESDLSFLNTSLPVLRKSGTFDGTHEEPLSKHVEVNGRLQAENIRLKRAFDNESARAGLLFI